MYRANTSGYTHFDERNIGGRTQVGAELRRFQTIVQATKPSREITPRDAKPYVYLHGRKKPEADHFPPPPCYPPGFKLPINIDEIWRCSSYQQRKEYREHCQRLAYLTKHVQDHNKHSLERRKVVTAETNFPAMHPSTRRISTKSTSSKDTQTTLLRRHATNALQTNDQGESSIAANKPEPNHKQPIQDEGQTSNELEEVRTPEISLPDGWDTAVDSKGRRYYIDHKNRQTTWDPPTDPKADLE
ncbi:hypothetical protein LEN26_020130 [Aphanomyces euteiches]|nr:hypothetical protein LEN26_020130 [Aphanomyces euteiches]KAH9128919.1 hypothetical protein AeMF1_000966 [Aphanomyces euteiches]KAH9131505.1 hypothetical protein AeNC1_019606 [Aphanomyces euteiches]